MQIKDLSFSYGINKIYDDVTLNIPDNIKLAIVGQNGAGKTTLFKLILNEETPTNGKIINNKTIAFLPQVIDDTMFDMNKDVFNYLLEARPIKPLENKLKELYQDLAEGKNKINQINKIENLLDYYDRYNYENILLKLISDMNLEEIIDKKLKDLSGGQKSKVAFAHLLYQKAQLILLDEPTNHLDKQTRDFVINYLKEYKGSVYIISHDIDFLDKIIDHTLFVDKTNHKMTLYNGNYSSFLKQYNLKKETLLREKEKEDKEIDKLQKIVDKYKTSSGKRKKMAEDREKKLNKILKNKIEIKQEKHLDFKLEINKESSNIPIKVNNLYFKYDKDYIIKDLSFTVLKGERILVQGKNGVGKSTLLKLLNGLLKPQKGQILIDKKTDIAYYAQEHETLDKNKTIIDNLKDLDISYKYMRMALSTFLFTEDDINKKVINLSPGERSRLTLCKIALKKANTLLLDEPTNHLDPETQEEIAKVFKDYQGTIILVSHNTNFIKHLNINRVLKLPEGKITYV